MGSLAEAWAKQRAYYDRMALIENAEYQRARADKAEAALLAHLAALAKWRDAQTRQAPPGQRGF